MQSSRENGCCKYAIGRRPMKTITNWTQLQHLEGEINDALKAELEEYFKELVTEMLEEDYQNHDISYIGPIAIVDYEDNLHHLPKIGMTSDTMTLLESIPEYIDTLNIGGEIYYRIIILFGGDAGVVIYVPEEIKQGQLANWIDTWKEES